VVILPRALEVDSEKWAKTYAGSITLGGGQFLHQPRLDIRDKKC